MRNTLLLCLPFAAALACSSDTAEKHTPDSCRGDRCDDLDKPDSEVDDFACDSVMVDKSGRNNRKLVGRLNDPLANLVLKTEGGCPTSFKDIVAKLRKTDADESGCKLVPVLDENGDETGEMKPADERGGMVTRLVSETAQAADAPTNYRAVTTRTCNSRDKHGLVFSLFGVSAGTTALPPNVEIIAFDKEAGVFNFYESDGRGEINFFGNSNDMLKGAEGQTRRCAECHNAGGLVMKELDTPWVHWEGHMDIPGAKDLVDAHVDLGTKASGSEFEGLVKKANKAWNDTRLTTLRNSKGLKETLRPLFCTVEVNIDNGASFKSPVIGGEGGSEMGSIPIDSLLDPHLKSFGSISIDFADYDAKIKSNGQTLAGIPGVPNAIDTVFDYVFIERSNVDNVYVDKLIDAGIIDEEFVKDVLMVDLTRPIFSDDRCDLLEFSPVLASEDFTPEKIKAGFLDKLGDQAPGSPAAELRNNLLTDAGHTEAVKVFTDACEALESADMVTNALQITSLNRNQARNLSVFEFAQTMPSDNLVVASGSRLNPTDCTVGREFIAITPQAATPEPDPNPEPEPSNDCAHDICTTGIKLDPTCSNACVAIICAGDADVFCCNDNWDDRCVGEVESICGQTCE